jgi:hypothetical protein
MKKSPQTITDIIGNGENDLAKILRRAQALNGLNEFIHEMLPPNLKERCSVANIRNKQLIILAESATWATLLRYEQGKILANLHQHPKYKVIESIKVKIAPVEHSSQDVFRRPKRPNHQSCQAINELAEIIEDEELSASINRLARSVRNKGA